MTNTKKTFFEKAKMKLKIFWLRHRFKFVIALLIFAFLLAFFWNNIVISIHSGHAGVLWSRFSGTKMNKVYGEGLHIIWPWDIMYDYTLRYLEHHAELKILTSRGLYVDMDISYRFHPEREDRLPDLHKLWGPQYAEKFVDPEVRAAAIAVLGDVTPEELFSISTQKIQSSIYDILEKQFKGQFIRIHDILITKLLLPSSISDAIERKITQEQLNEEYDFRLMVAEKEKQRKVIEATGVQLFNSISKIDILKWKGLTVTSEIARSTNAKVIIMGTGEKGLPVILNADGGK